MDIVATWIKGIYMYLINKVRFIFLRCPIPKKFVGEVRAKNYKKHQNGGKFMQIIECTHKFTDLLM